MRHSVARIDKKASGRQPTAFFGHAAGRVNLALPLAKGVDSHLRPLCVTCPGVSVLPLREGKREFTNVSPLGPTPAAPVTHITRTCPISPRRCPFGGACHSCPVRVQTKLTVNEPGDSYEQEAERIADQVMGMPEPRDAEKTENPGTTDIGVMSMQGQATDQADSTTAPPIVHEVLHSSGQPLDPATRAFMEPRFGHDFSRVRVHTNEQAAESASAINALAYTAGRDVVFGVKQYAPTTAQGQRLLAHELVHVMQQDGQPTQDSWFRPETVLGQESHNTDFKTMSSLLLHTGLKAPSRIIQRVPVPPTPEQEEDAQTVQNNLSDGLLRLRTVERGLVLSTAQRYLLNEILDFLATFVPRGFGILDQNGTPLVNGEYHRFFRVYIPEDRTRSRVFSLDVRFYLSHENGGEVAGRYDPYGTHSGRLVLYVPNVKDSTVDDLAELVVHEAVHMMIHLHRSAEARLGARAGENIPGGRAARIVDTGALASHRHAFQEHFNRIIGFLNQQPHRRLSAIPAGQASEWATAWLDEIIAYTYQSRVGTGLARLPAQSQPGPRVAVGASVQPEHLIYIYLIRLWLNDRADQVALNTVEGNRLMHAMRPAHIALQETVENRIGPIP